eukprot:scaffold76139_cov55-Phaeocystis_antarctica.AAC.1
MEGWTAAMEARAARAAMVAIAAGNKPGDSLPCNLRDPVIADPSGIQVFFASAVLVGRFRRAPLHRQRLVVAFEWKIFVVESGCGAVDVAGAGGQEHRQPLRRARDGVVDLRQTARHTGPRRVRDEGDTEGGGDADEDERAEARSRLALRLAKAGATEMKGWATGCCGQRAV